MFGMIAAATLAVQPALAQQVQPAQTECPNEAEQQMFELVALKSQLMVLATTCGQNEQYNAFINRYRPDLVSAEHEFNAWFKQHYGKRADTEHDRYITQLANAQSGVGLAQGTDFCTRNDVLFHEVMTLQNGNDLKQYAAAKELLPAAAAACEAPAAPVAKPVAKKK
jgi:hypothetical protein